MAKQDAFTLIKEDHDRFREMFSDYDDLPDDDYRAKLDLALRLYEALAAHETMEEEIFYPAIREHASKHGVEMVLEGYEEHHVADEVIAELKELDIEDETYDAKFKVLRENVEHHLDEEEDRHEGDHARPRIEDEVRAGHPRDRPARPDHRERG